jgi:hypothetical protein
MEVRGQLYSAAVCLPGKELRYRLNRRLGGPQKRGGSKRAENQNGTAKRVTFECSEQEETVKDNERGNKIKLWNYK